VARSSSIRSGESPSPSAVCDDLVVSLYVQLRHFRHDRLFIVPGFSGQISAQISAYDSTTSGRPNAYGFDLYGSAPAVAAGDYSSFGTQLDFISPELGAVGELSKELFAQKTYFNSVLAHNALAQATKKEISFRYLLQFHYRAGHVTNVDDVYDLSPYFSYASSGRSYPVTIRRGIFIYQDNLYYTNGHAYCQYTAVGPYVGCTVAQIPSNTRNDGFCSPAIPMGWFRVSDQLYYSYGSTYCSSSNPDADQVSGSTVFWGIVSKMTYVGGC
jgi:hypothetical protein